MSVCVCVSVSVCERGIYRECLSVCVKVPAGFPSTSVIAALPCCLCRVADKEGQLQAAWHHPTLSVCVSVCVSVDVNLSGTSLMSPLIHMHVL